MTISVLGINIGTFVGNLKDDLRVSIDLFLAAGSVRLYLKNGNELWIHVDIQVKFDGSFDRHVKLLSF